MYNLFPFWIMCTVLFPGSVVNSHELLILWPDYFLKRLNSFLLFPQNVPITPQSV